MASTDKGLRFTQLADSLPSTVPFVAPEMTERETGEVFQARLGANECNFGPSPKVTQVLNDKVGEVFKYPDPVSYRLRSSLADKHSIGIENIIVGEGIDGLLCDLCRLFIGPEDVVVTSLGAYPTFNYHVTAFGGRIETVPYKNDFEDLEALLTKATETQAKLVYLSNPDNPMGTFHSAQKIQRFINAMPAHTLLILDEAYIELAPKNSALAFDVCKKNVIRFRTFSKAYALAGARIGYGIGNAGLISAFNKVRNHFGVSKLSQLAAEAALADESHLALVQEKIELGRAKIQEIAQANGLSTIPSSCNFVAVDCGQDGQFAKRVLNGLLKQGIFVRMPYVAPQDRCIRVSVGLDHELEAFGQALPIALRGAKQA